jgi:hypothetical protein
MKTTKQLLVTLKELNPEAHCTYHHAVWGQEVGWVSHLWGVPISGYHEDKTIALREAINVLRKEDAHDN